MEIFRDDEHILKFIHKKEQFSNFNVIYEEGKQYQVEGDQLNNLVPPGLDSLEHIFYRHERRENYMDSMKPGDYIEINIGTNNEPKMIKIGKDTSEKERNDLINLIKEYSYVFSFTYDKLKSYREDVFQHTIPLKQDIKEFKPFCKKLRKINPKLAPIAKKDLEKMLVAGIIALTRNSSCCSNLVVVRKKNGSIRICIYF